MALGPGNRLGAYEIVSLLGAGGMGEVYRAKDTKLGREVALKILPAAFTDDPERIARFRREAQVLASLNHPHIGAIYGLEEANGTQFLVLELVDGESLDKRIARGKVPVDEALTVAKQIAEALEAAHEKGIIHPVWSPDGKALAFSAITDSSKFEFKVFRKAASGVGDVQPVFGFVGGLRPTAWSPNGRMLMVQTLDVSTRLDLWLVPATDEKAEPTPWLRTPFNENHAQFSTDGKWVAYASTETGISEVYLQSFPDASGKWQVSAGGANFPFWRKDGRELFYVDGKGALNAVDVQVSDKTVLIGHARELFDADLPSTTGGSGTHPSVPYAVSGDGQRFLLARMVNAETARAEIGVTMNWPALLTR